MDRYQQHLHRQSKVKVITRTKDNTANKVRLVLFAFAFSTFIYFFSSTLWRALGG
jgi:hypothetical protein